MRVLWLVRSNLTQHPGGDTTQILQTAQALRALGVQIDLCSDEQPRMTGYDLVQLFHLDRLWETEPYCRQIRAQGRPSVLSTIYWPPDEFDRHARAGFQGWLSRAAGSRAYESLRLVQRWGMQWVRRPSLSAVSRRMLSFRWAATFVLESVQVLLPNSRAEQEQIERRFGVRRPVVVVPNAADGGKFGPPAGAGGSDAAGLGGTKSAVALAGVLCVGRVEPRKNQLALIEALGGTGIPLIIVGQAGRYSAAYDRACRRAAGPNVRFLGQQPPEVLRAQYRAARVHACVSWYETPGLASLEAAVSGCGLVLTPGGCTREYFGDAAHYCAPDDVSSIRAAIQRALATEVDPLLAQRVAREYTWDAAAEKTLKGYRLALGGPSASGATPVTQSLNPFIP